MWTIDQDEFLYVYGENYVIRGLGDDRIKAALGEKILWEKDRSEMMLTPDGSFGVGDPMIIMKNSLPVRVVTLDDFYMEATESANAQCQQFFWRTNRP